jgi:hypothetical protein
MALSWFSVGKLIVGNLDTIIGVSKPLFTRAALNDLSNTLNKQIVELQAETTRQAEQIYMIASDLKEIVTALDKAAHEAAVEKAQARIMMWAALGLSAFALIFSIAAITMRR